MHLMELKYEYVSIPGRKKKTLNKIISKVNTAMLKKTHIMTNKDLFQEGKDSLTLDMLLL